MANEPPKVLLRGEESDGRVAIVALSGGGRRLTTMTSTKLSTWWKAS
jgi:hypothetical protein